mmetsp:Transcript_7029/g.16927  ORF Transcript_7029/g.16927 Transcript_7029/m.16927 type:complete len:144 (+) Transcript_7029:124-555(+)
MQHPKLFVLAGELLQQYGWHLVALATVVLMLKKPVLDAVYEQSEKAALKAAKSPERVRVLEVERQRVRVEQQERLAKAAEEQAKLAAKKKAEDVGKSRSERSVKKTRGPDSSRAPSYSFPLDGGGGGGGGYKPSGFTKKRGGG